MLKLDFKKSLKELYNPPSKEVVAVEIPSLNFLMIDGIGNPNTSPEYSMAVEALYSLAYNIKFTLKKQEVMNYTVAPLEGLWWADDMAAFSVADKDVWKWTMMIMQPDEVSQGIFQQAVADVRKKKALTNLDLVRLESFTEGKAAQIMHIGPYSAEGPIIQKVHAFIAENQYKLAGKHHEIYLGDPRKSDPAKLRTIIRQPYSQ